MKSSVAVLAAAGATAYGLWRWSEGRGGGALLGAFFGIPAILGVGLVAAIILKDHPND